MLTTEPQRVPPQSDGVSTGRVWYIWPPPHVAEQDEKDDHSPNTQSTGQQPRLHGLVSSGRHDGLHAPVEHVTERVCTPPPHVTEQVPQSPTVQPAQQAGSDK